MTWHVHVVDPYHQLLQHRHLVDGPGAVDEAVLQVGRRAVAARVEIESKSLEAVESIVCSGG